MKKIQLLGIITCIILVACSTVPAAKIETISKNNIDITKKSPTQNPTITNNDMQNNTRLKIGKIRGGLLRIKADIKNVGETTANNVSWEIRITGGILNRINISFHGKNEAINSNTSKRIKTKRSLKLLFGVGRVTITVRVNASNANTVTKRVKGFVSTFFVIVFSRKSEEFFIRGDANGDGEVNIADLSYLANYLCQDGPAPDPLDAGDVNDDENVSCKDILYLADFLFRNGTMPPPPYPEPGPDPTPPKK